MNSTLPSVLSDGSHSEDQVKVLTEDRSARMQTIEVGASKFGQLSNNVVKLQVCYKIDTGRGARKKLSRLLIHSLPIGVTQTGGGILKPSKINTKTK